MVDPDASIVALACMDRRIVADRGDDGRRLALVKCTLVTGRMHQIRVHLAAAGWPIVGDAKYGQPLWRDVGDPALRDALGTFTRQALHAWRLAIRHPLTGAPLSIEAPLPADLRRLLDAAGLVQCAR